MKSKYGKPKHQELSIEVNKMKDVQAQKDFRNVYLNQVGIKNFRTPLILMDPKNATQHTTQIGRASCRERV